MSNRRERTVTICLATAVAAVTATVWWHGGMHSKESVRFIRESEARARRFLRRTRRRSQQRKRFEQGRWQGFLYRTGNRFPDPEVGGDRLADRVRSMLGPIEKRYDLPRIHVTAERHRIVLHGDVDTSATAAAIIAATRHISGVREVVSHLKVGFTRGETRPSQGCAVIEPSHCLRELTDAAILAGVSASDAPAAIGAVLLTLLRRLPVRTRHHLAAHLPVDVIELLPPNEWEDSPTTEIHLVEEFVEEVTAFGALAPSGARPVVDGLLGRLRTLIPEEVGAIAATLPTDLRHLWTAA